LKSSPVADACPATNQWSTLMSLEDKGEDSANDDNETDNIDDLVHDFSPQIASAVKNAMPALGFRLGAPSLDQGRPEWPNAVRLGEILVEPSGIEPLTSSQRFKVISG
jgi:hypothetical protein